jgi:N-acetylmuramoyl-L-alanine amidase
MKVPAPKIITCSEWGARPPRQQITPCGKPNKALIHHTAGHHPEIANPANESQAEAIRYAIDLQRDMMDNRGWIDSGHNFLVCRNGMILQGRWGSVTAIEQGHMVVSAHCPGENDQPGIEHEHLGTEPMTPAQFQASAELLAWICDRTGIKPTQFYGHGHFYPTDCPANLNSDVPKLRLKAASILTQYHTAPEV